MRHEWKLESGDESPGRNRVYTSPDSAHTPANLSLGKQIRVQSVEVCERLRTCGRWLQASMRFPSSSRVMKMRSLVKKLNVLLFAGAMVAFGTDAMAGVMYGPQKPSTFSYYFNFSHGFSPYGGGFGCWFPKKPSGGGVIPGPGTPGGGSGSPTAVPELDGSLAPTALALMLGAGMILLDRRRRGVAAAS